MTAGGAGGDDVSAGRDTVAVTAALPRAGASARGQADLFAEEIEAVQSQIVTLNECLLALRESRRQWQAGSGGELRVVEVLVGMVDAGWRILPDRRWPGTTRANIDVLLVGPGGVFVVDVKNWADLRIEDGRLWRGHEEVDDADKLGAQCAAVEGALAEVGLPASEVVPILALAGRSRVQTSLGPIEVLGERDLPRYLLRRGVRLDAAQVDVVAQQLDRVCPPMPERAAAARRQSTGRHARRTPVPTSLPREGTAEPSPRQGLLLSTDDLWRDLAEVAAQEPIESWMTWLHPMQARLVGRSWSGPARIRGAAGTGKTVVALHRARHLARTTGRPVLFTSFVNTLPTVYRSLMQRMDPQAAGLVEFASIHSWAAGLLANRGLRPTIDSTGLQRCFHDAWLEADAGPSLDPSGLGRRYWHDELRYVIKGRGLVDRQRYLELARVGRRTPLQRGQREAVWSLFAAYERLRQERGLHDWEDLLILARNSLAEQPCEPGYGAVVVDEVQDLSCVGVQLLHQLVGDRPDGLLLVGDGQQSIYPGGFSLVEAGVTVTGRAVVLDRNYRNGSQILRHALRVVADDEYDDLDDESLAGVRDVQTTRSGGRVLEILSDDRAGQEAALVASLVDARRLHGARWGDAAVLCASNAAADRWLRVLASAGVPAMSLRGYDGEGTDRVKVGTYQRAKGLEFAYVFVPDVDGVPRGRGATESDEAFGERAALERRQLFVAMTRARDGLWLGRVAR